MSFIGKVLAFTFTHAAQADLPNASYASSAAFKLAIDSQATQLQTALNSVIDQLNSVIALSSGTENLGSAPIAGVAGGLPSTAYAQIADIKSQLTGLVLGLIPDGTVTLAKLAPTVKTGNRGGKLYTYRNQGGF